MSRGRISLGSGGAAGALSKVTGGDQKKLIKLVVAAVVLVAAGIVIAINLGLFESSASNSAAQQAASVQAEPPKNIEHLDEDDPLRAPGVTEQTDASGASIIRRGGGVMPKPD